MNATRYESRNDLVPPARIAPRARRATPTPTATLPNRVASSPMRMLSSEAMSTCFVCSIFIRSASLQVAARRDWDVVERAGAAPLQGPHIEDDCPSIFDVDLTAVGRHVADAVGDGVEDLA